MGVDFHLASPHLGKSAARALQRLTIPAIDARFAASEWPRFLAHLADAIGLRDLWREHDQLGDELTREVMTPILANLADPGKRNPPAAPSPRVQQLNAQLADWRRRASALKPAHPLLHLMLASQGVVPNTHCRAVADQLAAIVQAWPAAPAGRVGWREHSLELAAALRFAADHPPLALCICE
jgi:hypothetical protein